MNKTSELPLDSTIRGTQPGQANERTFPRRLPYEISRMTKIVFKVISQVLDCSLVNHFPGMSRITPVAFSTNQW